MFDTHITIEVGTGEDKRTFRVFKGVLCFYSGYFNAALNGRFIEAQQHAVKLETEDPKIFDMFRHWIHNRCFFESTLAPSRLLSFRLIAGLWIFGDAHEVPMLQNEVVNVMIQKIQESLSFPSIDDLIYINENTVESSTLRSLLADILLVLYAKELVWASLDPDRPDELFPGGNLQGTQQPLAPMRLVRRFGLSYKQLQLPGWYCKGHVHSDGVQCPRR